MATNKPIKKCSIAECDNVARSRGWCNKHYLRWNQHGDVNHPVVARIPNIGECEVDGCGQPKRKRQWCASHYSQWHVKGEVKPFQHKWANEGLNCKVCGQYVESGQGRREYCSSACQVAGSRHKKGRPVESTCVLCKKSFSLKRRAIDGRLQRTDTLWCRDCGRDSPDALRYKKYKVTPEQYREAIKSGCEICGVLTDKLHVDHDHSCCKSKYRNCGKCTRGFLCGNCNRALGMFKENVASLRNAINYLEGKR